jgi:formate C-acetyltransferase
MFTGAALPRGQKLNLAAIRQAYLIAPEQAVFLERARILDETRRKYAGLPSGVRQGRVLQDLCAQITPVVCPDDVLLGRVREQAPTAEEEAFISARPELFNCEGVPGWLESAGIYVPDWGHLLRAGIGGLIEEVESVRRDAAPAAQDTLEGIRLSLKAVSTLLTRYAGEARRAADGTKHEDAAARLRRAAEACEAVAVAPAKGLHEAIQLFLAFHMALSCLVGGRNVTPGRMDQYLLRYYEKDLRDGRLSRQEAVELVAAMMLMLSQLSGSVATDFQSKKRTPNQFSHYYITLGGVKADGSSAVNELSNVFLDARRLVEFRDPTLSIRYFAGIDREFWCKAVALMRDGLPVFSYNDASVLAAQKRHGVPDEQARDYAHCGCLFCVLPGRDLPPSRANHNGPLAVLLAINGGVEPVTGKRIGEATPPAEAMGDFESFFAAFRKQMRYSLAAAAQHQQRDQGERSLGYPLLARPLLDGCLRGAIPRRNVDQCFVGVATTIDSLLAVREVVYRRKTLTLTELAAALRKDFAGYERLRAYLMNRVPSYGCDDPEVTEMTRRVSEAWVEDVAAAGRGTDVVLRPAFYTWLYNLEFGKVTGATPDGRLAGTPLSSDQAPSRGRGRAPTEVLRAMAQLPHDHTCSGGTIFSISPSLFRGPAGADRLAALIEGYFAQGGLQLHFIVADIATLRDAVKHPERHEDLLVRVAGFSEYFVRLLPEVQQEIIRRAQSGADE